MNRTISFQVKFHKIAVITTTKIGLNTTYRCIISTIILKLYNTRMKTTNTTECTLALYLYDGLHKLKHLLGKENHTCIIFKQSEKCELSKMGSGNINTQQQGTLPRNNPPPPKRAHHNLVFNKPSLKPNS